MGPIITGFNTFEHLFKGSMNTLSSEDTFSCMCAVKQKIIKQKADVYMKGVLQKKWNYTVYKNKSNHT